MCKGSDSGKGVGYHSPDTGARIPENCCGDCWGNWQGNSERNPGGSAGGTAVETAAALLLKAQDCFLAELTFFLFFSDF